MSNDDAAATALERTADSMLVWLRREVDRHDGPPRLRLLAIWEALETWFVWDDFQASDLAAALAAPGPEGPAVAAVLARHRQAFRQLLEDLAEGTGVLDPTALAAQLHLLVEGAVVGALIDREPQVARHASELTELALAAAGAA